MDVVYHPDLPVDRDLLRGLLKATVERLREYFGHDVKGGSIVEADPNELARAARSRARSSGIVLVGIPSWDDGAYASVKRVLPDSQCFTERVLENESTLRYAATALATGIHCKLAGQPFAVKTRSSVRNAIIAGVDVSRAAEGGGTVEGRGCCSCFAVDEEGTIRHHLTFTTTIGERGETSAKTAEAVLQDLEALTEDVDADPVIYLRDGRIPDPELEALQDASEDLNLIPIEVIKSHPTVHTSTGKPWLEMTYFRVNRRTVLLYPRHEYPRATGGAKPGTRRPILLQRKDGGELDKDLIQLISDLTASNWATPAGATSRLPAPVLYADRAARLARYGVTVSPREELARRPWPV